MRYRVEFTETALKEFKKLDRHISLMITSWIGDYWLLCAIQDEKITILVVTVGHRREVYEKH